MTDVVINGARYVREEPGLKRPFGDLVREARKARNETLRSVSSKVGVDMGCLSEIERQQRTPHLTTFVALVAYFRIDLNEIDLIHSCVSKHRD